MSRQAWKFSEVVEITGRTVYSRSRWIIASNMRTARAYAAVMGWKYEHMQRSSADVLLNATFDVVLP